MEEQPVIFFKNAGYGLEFNTDLHYENCGSNSVVLETE
jgi:hypothetical protein